MRLAHRVRTTATPAQVWQVLGDPQRWAQFEVSLRGVRGAHGQVATGQRLIGVARAASLGIPIDVLEAQAPSRLVVLVHVLPGLREQLGVEVVPAARGGSQITVSVVVDGPLARPSLGWVYLGAGLTSRLLARRADRLAAQARAA